MSTATIEKKQNGQATGMTAVEERSVSYVPIGEKDELVLTITQVEKYLCVKTTSGKVACRDDIVKFMMLCKAQGLNPWLNDAYLIGYDTKDGPKFQLITAHHSLLKRAELSPAYDGMESGVCVISQDASLQERPGDLVLPSEKVVGGWSRVHRRDRKVPSYDSLSLATFSTGRSRWNADPAGMIVKCAEASALRKAFPSTLAQMFCREEMERQLEFGDRDRHQQRINISAEPSSSKSEQIVAALSRRVAPQEPEDNKDSGVSDEQQEKGEASEEKHDSNESSESPSFQKCKTAMQTCEECVIGLDKKIEARATSGTPWFDVKLSNGGYLRVSDGHPGELDPATQWVDANEADVLVQIGNILTAKKKH
jgi:phage recombination protein Bet